ncbi:DoxX family protein [Sphingomonas sp. ASV193]|uniref:DoxX family protein n=1 Tax=Sphingomonas sp. ASV193 TaxID=3144405 RepID=UPI0032E8A920
MTKRSTGKSIAIWVLRLFLGLAFLAAAAMKLSGQPMMVAEFDKVGLGQGFRYLTGLLELAGGIAILVPRSSTLGALTLLLVDVGAFVAQLLVLHGDVIHTLVIAALLVVLIALQRRSGEQAFDQSVE